MKISLKSWILIGWLPITLFQMLNFLQVLKIAYVGGFLPFLDPLHTIKTFSARFPTRLPTAFPTRFSHKIFPQDFPARFSCKISCKIAHSISRKIFPQDFPARFSRKIFLSWIPIANAKFPPITALLNMPTYHKSAKVSPPPFPQISWEPQINE